MTKPSNIGKAGLYGIFCTQSNDFALGYPLLTSLYGTSNPQFARYLYVLAPIQLVILNPIGLFLLEIHKFYRREERTQNLNHNYLTILLSVMKSIIKNPIIFMTIIGIGWNLMFSHTIPAVLSPLLEVLSNSFSATALFLLGLNLVGKFKILNGSSIALMVPLILVMTKILILPLLSRVIIQNIMSANNNETLELSNFGFLYGTFPSAPTVFIFGLQYDISLTVVSTGIVMSTILSAPLMFVSANMIRLSSNSLPYIALQEDLGFTMCYSGLLTVICVSWVLIVLICGHKWKSVTHRCTMALALSQLSVGIGGYLWQYIDSTDSLQRYYLTYHLQYMFAVFGILSSRIWTAMLSITLALMHWKSLCFVIRIHKRLSTFAAVITIVLLLMIVYIPNYPTNKKIDPNFEFGSTQAYIAVVLLICSLILTIVGLITHQHFKSRLTYYQSLSVNSDDNDNSTQESQPTIPIESNRDHIIESRSTRRGRVRTSSNQSNCSNHENCLEVEDLIGFDFTFNDMCPHSSNCNIEQRKECASNIRRYRNRIEEANEVTPLFGFDSVVDRYSADYHQVFHHVFLLLTLLLSMFIGLTVSISKLVLEKPSGIFIELEFLDILLNYGQGVITFLIFGLETTPVFDKLSKLLWIKRSNSDSSLNLPTLDNIRPATKQICDQFITFHKQNCINDILFERRIGQNSCLVFHGRDLVDWLLKAGLSSDRRHAQTYGRNLLIGRIIEHVTHSQHFFDGTFLYKFT